MNATRSSTIPRRRKARSTCSLRWIPRIGGCRMCWCCIRCPNAPARRGCARGLRSVTGRSWPRSIACASTARRARRCRCSLRRRRCGRRTATSSRCARGSSDRKDIADRLLGGFPGLLPVRRAGFFYGSKSTMAWRSRSACGATSPSRCCPGAYLTQPDAAGANAGHGFVRIALVHDPDTTREGLARLAGALGAFPEVLARETAARDASRQGPEVGLNSRDITFRAGFRPILRESMMRKQLALATALMAAFTGTAFAGKTLDTIKQRGPARLRRQPGLPGFSAADSQGNWTGLDVDICKALAAVDPGRREQGEVGAAQRVSSASPRCSRARSTSCRATRPGR